MPTAKLRSETLFNLSDHTDDSDNIELHLRQGSRDPAKSCVIITGFYVVDTDVGELEGLVPAFTASR
jgi:hypothetical protein